MFSQSCPTDVALNRQFLLCISRQPFCCHNVHQTHPHYSKSEGEFDEQHIIVPGSSTNVVYRADDRNDEHDDMMH